MNTKRFSPEPFDLHGTDVEVHLKAGAVVSVDVPAGGVDIESRRGTLWVTQPADATDYVVPEGWRVTAARPGRLVVQALSDASIHVNPASMPAGVREDRVAA
jgi:hypothetical protein